MTDAPKRIPVCSASLDGNELAYLTECIRTGWVSSSGPFVARFEKEFAAWCGTAHAVTTSSGTASLHLALLALGLGPGDEVIVPALTMIATGNAVLYTGATPVVVDVEPDTGNLDPAAVEAALSPRTRAVIPVHLYGLPCSMTALRAVCEPRGIALVEDAAEAIGTTALGRAAGTLGRAGCFSFFANKVLTTGEGGMLVTDDPALAARGRSFKDQWFVPERRFFHPHVGYNYRMSNLQAALGVAQLERVACLAAARRTVAAVYRKLLAGLPALELPLDQWQDGTNSHWMYAVRVQADAGATADALARHLAQDGIESRGFFHPLSRQPAFAAFGRPCPVAEEIAPRGLLLPTGPTLAVADQERIADSLRRFFQSPRPRV